jgi:hypothetical protein
MKSTLLKIAAAVSIPMLAASNASAVNVGLELALLTDVSGSVDAAEYDLQKQGYVLAFQSTAVHNAILGSVGGSIAVTYIEWAGQNSQSVLVDWRIINSVQTALNFAFELSNTSRAFVGGTAPGSAINFAVPRFASNIFDAPRQVIDVSGDGQQNEGANTAAARDAALAAGIDAINGLPILGEPGLLAWYQNNIQAGAGSFTVPASNFASFNTAIQNKLIAEITGNGVPDGGSTMLFISGALGCICWFARRRVMG